MAGRALGVVVHLGGVTVSMRVMSAGEGYRYLLKSVAVGDGARALSSSLTRYYAEVGTPSGRWLGSGLPGLADGGPVVGEVVSEEQLRLLIGEGRDPISGDPLGRAYRRFSPVAARVAARVAALAPELSGEERAGAVARIEGEEEARPCRRAVAGFDFTFSVPKSASILWGLGNERVRGAVEDAHRAAIADVLAFMEREVAATRTGASDGSGAVLQADVTGLIATGYDHFDSRAGDPHLHTHLVIASRARTVGDGKWRSLDGRPLHAAVVALSELHEAVFADRLTALLGLAWEPRAQGRDRNPSWTVSTVPDALLREFSSRSRAIDIATDCLIDGYRDAHGHRPSPAVVMRLRAQATLQTRPEKHVQPLAVLQDGWRDRATAFLDTAPVVWAGRAARPSPSESLRAVDVSSAQLAAVAELVVEAVGEKRSTWTHWNLLAEAARQTMGWRFVTPADREEVVTAVVAAAEHASVPLSPPEVAATPAVFRRADGSSRFRPRYTRRYTSQTLLAAESRLLEAGRTFGAPAVPHVVARHLLGRLPRGVQRPGADQRAAVLQLVTSGRQVDVLVGPAGAGKTTTMAAVRHVWEHVHGVGAVVGLAPSAAAAEVLAADLGIPAENTAKWLHDHHAGAAAPVRSGQLVIVDEASLSGTGSLDAITRAVTEAGGKVLLVGDHAQLQAVDAGGAFALLAVDRPDTATLTDVHWFRGSWEKTASLRLREGDPAVLDVYRAHDRIRGGSHAEVVEAALAAWRADQDAGRSSLLVADTADTVHALNERARAARILARSVDPVRAVRLHEGSSASAGDVVITRRNDRRLSAGRRWVRNGDRWQVLRTFPDGSVTVRRAGPRLGGSVRLPADYVRAEVELGYAVTTHRAQGGTVDTAHTLITDATSREAAYVGLTRGRRTNTAWVVVDRPDAAHTQPSPGGGGGEEAAVEVLTGVLARSGVEQSAHQVLRAEQYAAASIRVLVAEYDTIATHAQHERWTGMLRTVLPPGQADAVVGSEAFGPLCRSLRRAEAQHADPAALIARVVGLRPLDDAADVAAVLHARLERAIAAGHRSGRLIVGLVPEALGPMDEEMRIALDDRQQLMEHRATALAAAAVETGAAWAGRLGRRPDDDVSRAVWERRIRLVAAYRDLHDVRDETPLGASAATVNQERDAVRVAAALATRTSDAGSHRRASPVPRQVIQR